MTLTLADQYFLKALDDYPYNLEDTIESLTYALGYDDEHLGANCLMGKVYLEQFQDFDKAEEYFIKAMSADPFDLRTCESYVQLLIKTRRLDQAHKLVRFTKTLTGVDLARLGQMEAEIFELKGEFDRAVALLTEAIAEAMDSELIYALKRQIERVKMKRELKNEFRYSFTG